MIFETNIHLRRGLRLSEKEDMQMIKKFSNKACYINLRAIGLALSVLLLALVLCLTACNGDGITDSTDSETTSVDDTVITTEADGSTDETESDGGEESVTDGETTEGDTNGETDGTTTETETETSDTLEYPNVDPDDFQGVFISRVYGNGGKADGAAEHSFVELYNSTNEPVSLFGLSLYCKSDGADPFAQFPFPEDAIIPPNGFYLVRGEAAKGYYENLAVLHIDSYDAEWKYSIDNNGYKLMLAPVGLSLPKDTDVLTYGGSVSSLITIPDGEYHASIYAVDNISKNKVAVRTSLTQHSGFHKINLAELNSTELANNAPRYSGGINNSNIKPRISEVVFSKPAGIYSQQFKLTLSAPEGYTIYYTLNGDDPRTDGNKYSAQLIVRDSSAVDWTRKKTISMFIQNGGNPAKPTASTMMGGLTVKAYATNGTDSTPVYTSTYFVVPKLLEMDYTVMAMSIPAEEFVGPDGFYVKYGSGLDTPRPRGNAVMEVFDSNGVRVGYSNIEAAISGHGSSGGAMKSMRIYYKGTNNTEGGLMSDLDYDLFEGRAKDVHGQAITSFSRLLLRNSGNDAYESMFRDAYMQAASAELGADYMEYEPVFLFVNGEFWGVYNARERYSGEYVESHYGVNKDNITILENDYSQVHTNKNAPYIVSSGLQEDADHFNNLIAYVKANDLSIQANYDYVCSQLDVDSLIATYVSRLFFAAPDWPDNNIKIWRNRDANDPSGVDTKWHFTLLDLDFGLHTEHVANYDYAIGPNSVCSNLMAKLLTNESFKLKFITTFYDGVKNVMTEEKNLALLDAMAKERLELMPYIVQRWGNEGRSVYKFRTELAEMRGLLVGKNQTAIQGMRTYFRLTAAQLEEMLGKQLTVSFNPTRLTVKIDGENMDNGNVLVFDGDSKTYKVAITVKDGYEFIEAVVTLRDGTKKTYTTPSFSFVASMSATLTVTAKKTYSGGSSPADGTIVAGASYMFYLSPDGELYGWGDNTNGVLGLGADVTSVSKPTFIMDNVKKISTTDSTNYEQGNTTWATAVLTNDGKLYTVGCNNMGQLGRAGGSVEYTFGLVSFNGVITDVSMGYDHMLIIDDKGNLYGIGNNNYGQLGATNAGLKVTFFQRIATGVKMANAARRTTVYVTNSGDMYGLGDNRWNKLDANAADSISSPIKIMSKVKFIDSGEQQLLVITEDGALYYAGWRTFSGWGTGNGNSPAFYKVASSGVVDADIYYDNMVVLMSNGDVYVYGNNTGSALGASSTNGQLVKSSLIENVVNVAAGYSFTAYMTADGILYTHGLNTHGQGGNGTMSGILNMTEVALES